ncbi:MAG: hybrid sensor histidine kinase/response regulator [Stagnimonas sp.]|nr:hybrid sensor histidine kinase/response regulator [Stagnimonas sp.]
MLDLFRIEAETQTQVLVDGLLALERDPTAAEQLEACMRAAHSLKGAARIVGVPVGVSLSHSMEDCFVAAQRGNIRLGQRHIDLLLRGVDLLSQLAKTPELELGQWTDAKQAEVSAFISALSLALTAPAAAEPSAPAAPAASAPTVAAAPAAAPADTDVRATGAGADRILRVTADNLNRLLGLAGESLVESRWLKPFAESLLRLKRQQQDSAKSLETLREALSGQALGEQAQTALAETLTKMIESRQVLAQRLVELELYDHRAANLAHRLYTEALACRMRPFADGIQAFPRMVRDVGHALGKQVRLELIGEATQVDRDILEKLDAPLGHLLRNAVDHGIDTPEQRRAAGKPEVGVIRLEARHSAGMLQIIVADDGRGVDLDRVRAAIVERKLTNAETAARLSEAELLEFLFLPGFSMKGSVTEISGRGVGLDAVQNMVKQVRGTVRISSQPGLGTRFLLQLPLTLSVVRTLLVDIGGEAYAFPLAYIVHTLKLPKDKIELLEGRQHFTLGGRQVGLVAASQVLGGDAAGPVGEELPVIVVGDQGNSYGLVVDRFRGERELVVQPLDARLGKIKDISSGALMEDGSPVLIVDVEDLLRSVDKLVSAGQLNKIQRQGAGLPGKARRRVLVVDDSLTVRELERKLLSGRGYEVEIAVDGMDGWNAVRTGHFHLVISDIDMPRMDGIELVSLIKKDPNLKSIPVMIVSYKDREEDRQRGLEAGADYYLTKGSFHDETLLQAVADLIGAAEA